MEAGQRRRAGHRNVWGDGGAPGCGRWGVARDAAVQPTQTDRRRPPNKRMQPTAESGAFSTQS
jgi:hypothetical protein